LESWDGCGKNTPNWTTAPHGDFVINKARFNGRSKIATQLLIAKGATFGQWFSLVSKATTAAVKASNTRVSMSWTK
jgi:hypothetical protein